METVANILPSSLPILPLSNYVLLPSIVTSLSVCRSDMTQLLKNNPTGYIICVPLATKNKRGNNNKTASVTTDYSQLFYYGCVAKIIHQDDSLPNLSVIKVEGVCRSRIRDICSTDGASFEALLEHYPDNSLGDFLEEDKIVFRLLVNQFIQKMRLIGVSASVLNELHQLLDCCCSSYVANLVLCITDAPLTDKLNVLEVSDMKQKLNQVEHAVNTYLEMLDTVSTTVKNDMLFDNIRRNFYFLQQTNSIANANILPMPKEESNHFNTLPEDDEETIDLVKKLNDAKLPEYAATAVRRDLNRLRKLPPSSSDSAVLRIYIEYIGDLPWHQKTSERISLSAAKDQLDADHFGIEQVKTRMLEYLSVLKVKKDAKAPIICFVGPPGVGKTTLGMSIATALQRKFHRLSLGGVRDEAEIRGHRRTYVGALPGIFIHGMRQCGVQNPVFLLDEIDKLAQGSTQGDPAAALLEVLDPAQNSTFTDHFLNLPYDLSQVLFIATANSLDTIPKPLLDRMEVIHLDGYTFNEKLYIAQTHLIPKQLEAHGLSCTSLDIPDKVVMHVAEKYTRESGVRGLERLMASICRYKCREYADLQEAGRLEEFDRSVTMKDLEVILGPEPFEDEVADTEEIPGVTNGLFYAGSGNGGIMLIEANYMPGSGRLKLTGSLGDVIKESAELAVSWIKANAFSLKLTSSPKQDLFKDIDLHIHMPSGAVPKDGPSAGITMVTCLVSLLSGNCVPRTTAMTGEVTLRGQVRPVGGIKEKVISAHRAGITKIILPAANRRDIKNDIPQEIQNEMTFHYCKNVWDVIEYAFDHSSKLKWEPRYISSL